MIPMEKLSDKCSLMTIPKTKSSFKWQCDYEVWKSNCCEYPLLAYVYILTAATCINAGGMGRQLLS